MPLHPEQIEPYLPYEFTCEGMLQRVNAFIENQVRLPAALVFYVSKKKHFFDAHVLTRDAVVLPRRTSATVR